MIGWWSVAARITWGKPQASKVTEWATAKSRPTSTCSSAGAGDEDEMCQKHSREAGGRADDGRHCKSSDGMIQVRSQGSLQRTGERK